MIIYLIEERESYSWYFAYNICFVNCNIISPNESTKSQGSKVSACDVIYCRCKEKIEYASLSRFWDSEARKASEMFSIMISFMPWIKIESKNKENENVIIINKINKFMKMTYLEWTWYNLSLIVIKYSLYTSILISMWIYIYCLHMNPCVLYDHTE